MPSYEIFTTHLYTEEAFKMLMPLTKGKLQINVVDILNNNFLPNYGTDLVQKANLGYLY